jgi:hypothetical protein
MVTRIQSRTVRRGPVTLTVTVRTTTRRIPVRLTR